MQIAGAPHGLVDGKTNNRRPGALDMGIGWGDIAQRQSQGIDAFDKFDFGPVYPVNRKSRQHVAIQGPIDDPRMLAEGSLESSRSDGVAGRQRHFAMREGKQRRALAQLFLYASDRTLYIGPDLVW
jgi:hypothetical protein